MPQSELAAGSEISHFKILARLGQGGMGTVYKAVDLRLDRLVALKFISPLMLEDTSAIGRFQQEARLASQLIHPNIATVFEFDTAGGQHFIAMEFIQGQTVRQRMQGKPLSADDLRQLALGAASGLGEAHRKGILHRDIKAGNIVFTENNTVKILDFGLAKSLSPEARPQVDLEDRRTEVATVSGQLVGTYSYMPPEVLCGRSFVPASDVFSLGVLLYEAAAGCLPFDGPTPALVMDAILNRQPAPPCVQNPALESRWDPIILKCLDKDPGKRFADGAELLRQLESNQAQASVARTGQRVSKPLPFFGKWRHVVAAIVLLLLMVALALWLPRRIQAPIEETEKKPARLVVLPFEQVGPELQDASYLAQGISDEVYRKLSQIGGLLVTPMDSAAGYSRRKAADKQLREELGVDAVLRGTITEKSGEILIHAGLEDCVSGKSLWSQNFRQTLILPNVEKIKEEIARSVLESLHIPVTVPESSRLRGGLTANPEAYQKYRQGRVLLSLFAKKEGQQAIEAFTQALKLDPGFAEAHVGIAEAHFNLAAFGWMRPQEAYAQAEIHAKEALKLDPRASEAYRMVANIYSMQEGRPDLAEQHYRKAIEFEPSNVLARSWLALEFAYQGRFTEAQTEIQKALELDPFSPLVAIYCGGIKYLSGDYLEAEVWSEKAIEKLQPKLPLAYLLAGAARLCRGKTPEARQVLQEGLRHANGPTWALACARLEGLLAVCDLREGKTDSYEKGLAAMRAKYAQDHMYAYPLGVAYAAGGNSREALAWLQRAIDKRAFGWQEIRVDPFLGSVRAQPGFQNLIKAGNTKAGR